MSKKAIIFPGQGAAQSAMNKLKRQGLDQLITQLKQPVLGICLGMQLLCESTEEGHIDTLGVIPGKVSLLETGQLTSPHMGWNNLHIESAHALTQGLLASDQVYFVHSFAFEVKDEKAVICTTDYEKKVVAALLKENIFGTQFHPEKSQSNGLLMLKNFVNL